MRSALQAPRAYRRKEPVVTILFAYDGSESSGAAIAAAGRLFDHHQRPDAVVLTIWEPLTVEALRAMRFGGGWTPIPSNVGEVDERDQTEAEQLAGHGARLATKAGFEARALWVADERRIADTIVEEADALEIDLIVMGARGLSGVGAFFGSVSNHVLQHASRPILVVPPQKATAANPPNRKESPAVSQPLSDV
jgi:nucleotide-binding universal stress UspA family protein